MFLTAVGMGLIVLWLSVYCLSEAKFVSLENFWGVFWILWAIALLGFWIAQLALAIRTSNKKLRRIFLIGTACETMLVSAVMIPEELPMVWRVHTSRSSLDEFVRTVPNGWSFASGQLDSFPIQRVYKDKDIVWLECWVEPYLNSEGLAYHRGGVPPSRDGIQYWHLEGPWYFWHEPHS